MNNPQALQEVQRTMLLHLIDVLVAPVFMFFAVLACTGTPLTDTPVYICPTPVPLPTSTVLAGTPQPTPRPQPTPYVILPPTDFFVGDAVFIGTSVSENGVRFRLQSVGSQPASPDGNGEPRNVYTWQLEVKNIGTADYEVFPSAQMFLNEISTAYGDQTGVWSATREAADEAGVPFDDDAYRLDSGETRVFRFAAYGPVGQASRFAFQLDPTVSDGSEIVTWTNQNNPHCAGDIRDP
ncbi:MAG: hypothetical protein D6711_09235 [Chloroflexi bacterium]|nr:MAG: hypothetical protein D6711_09235 [Chloroflexota bacterium]